jgi:hypothetical protein
MRKNNQALQIINEIKQDQEVVEAQSKKFPKNFRAKMDDFEALKSSTINEFITVNLNILKGLNNIDVMDVSPSLLLAVKECISFIKYEL